MAAALMKLECQLQTATSLRLLHSNTKQRAVSNFNLAVCDRFIVTQWHTAAQEQHKYAFYSNFFQTFLYPDNGCHQWRFNCMEWQ